MRTNNSLLSFSVAVFVLLASAVLNSCGVYKKYQSQTETPEDLYGTGDTIAQAMSDASIASISWREFFTDPLLQQLIDSALARNTDMASARLAVEQAQASLKAAKLAYIPSLSLNPQANISTTMFGAAGSGTGLSYSYNVPLQLDWNIGISGSVTVNKRKTQAVLEQAKASRDATQANLIATMAQEYFELLLLDKQLEILIKTDSLWDVSLETERALWENGQAYSTAVNQMESSCMDVKRQIIDTRRSILSVENEICKLLRMTPHAIERHKWGEYALPERFGTGVPAVLLENRPDIKAADQALAEAFYNTAAARAQFFPSFSLAGLLGWTNNAGMIANPGALLMQLAASITQPIFAAGKLSAQLKIAKYNQEDKLNQYVQTVIEAGNQVNEALADCQTARDKDALYKRQVEVLQDAYDGTHELMNNGKASYLEVLTAQESLLSAQLNAAENMYNGALSLIGLYIALGGAVE
ncbi:MAG: TolC family protein [Paludibacteraceae bacterium]|nr:TolC family protein [Paludibacteraceae bacterium]